MRKFICYGLMLAVLASSALASSALLASDTDDSTVTKLREYMDAQARIKHFSGSVLVARDDEVLLGEGYGFANLEHEVANTPITKFRIGSITKQFTAMGILLLQDQGKLDVQDPISKHLAQAPDTWSPVTIHHLLTHTSGVPSYTSMPEYGQQMMLHQSLEEMMERFQDKPLDFQPGERFSYSNSGYFLLGVIIERASGQSYEDYLREQVFEPLNMKDTGYDRGEKILKHRAAGYTRRGGQVFHDRYLDMSQPYAAGALYSTVEDLNRWDQALRARKLLSEKGYEQFFRPDKQSYAYGWRVQEQDGHKLISHGGGINGFRTQLLRVVDEKICVAVLTNSLPSDPGRVANDLVAILLGKSYDVPRERKFISVENEVLDRYTGSYTLMPSFVLTVTREGNSLVAAPTGQPPATLKAESETVFYVDSVDAQLTFVVEEGEAVAVVLNQGGRELRGKRNEEKAP